MGILSRLLQATKRDSNFEYTPDSEQEGWTAILYSIIAADGEVKDVEIDNVCDILSDKNFFEHYDITDLYRLVSEAHKKTGGKEMIEKACGVITEENKACVLALAADLVLSDGHKSEEEEDLSNYLAEQLNIEASIAKNIFDVISWKNKYNKVKD